MVYKPKKKISLIQARHKAHFPIKVACKNLRVSMDTLRSWEYMRVIPNDREKQKLADCYGLSVDDIDWRRWRYSDVTIAAHMMGVTPLTMRHYLQQGRYGIAIKGTGEKFTYIVNWDEVEKWEEVSRF